MSRTLRRVPANWEHPKKIENGKENYKSLHQRSHAEDVIDWQIELADWLKGYRKWQQGIHIKWDGSEESKNEAFTGWIKSLEDDAKQFNGRMTDSQKDEIQRYTTKQCNYTEIAGEPPTYPNPDDYMPEDGEWYQVFETVSEGSPITPPFATTEELVDWLVNNEDFWGQQWSRESAEYLVKNESVPSMVLINNKLSSSNEVTDETFTK